MSYDSQNPLIVQSDMTVLAEVGGPRYEAARDVLARFAELEKSPEYIHTYRISPLSLWNAAAAGLTADEITGALETYSKYDIPQNVSVEIRETLGRYGRIRLERSGKDLILSADDPLLITEISRHKSVRPYLNSRIDARRLKVDLLYRGHLKQALTRIGFPVKDLAGYVPGRRLVLQRLPSTRSGLPFRLRDYQREAAEIFHAGGGPEGGSGVVVLPCGAGKTIVGIAAIERLQTQALILTTNITASRQWKAELLDKTDLKPDQIGEYSGEVKEIRPITVATYNILTYRKKKGDAFPHFAIFNQGNWGIIIYDEVHLLPAPVFRFTAELQARRRLGLTATLVREDGLEADVFSLIGPKRFDVPWRDLESKGWIATAECREIRLPLPQDLRLDYAVAGGRGKFRIASENPAKIPLARQLIRKHDGDQVLVIGKYVNQVEAFARELNAPVITGKTPSEERDLLYARFRQGDIRLMVVSKVANFAVDLPDANVAIQISGTFGSRQEEAQRLGRILRPKANGSLAHFYTLVTRDTRELEFARKRQTFLTEQGYRYSIRDAADVFEESGAAPV
ncbi:MAG: DEAD/DEAH box helicase [Gemmatimonadota bacterium]|nr:DEAD/DEAH box helicase [Gemmatimonadota bacterium]